MVVKVIGKTDTFTVIFDRIDEKRWNALVPVSYTHLDVYKRQ